ncbi:hypothetical protein ACOSQ4_010273 [Xanthoceras sorbifolium]
MPSTKAPKHNYNQIVFCTKLANLENTRPNSLTHTFHLPKGHRVLIPRASDGPAYPSLSYVAISSHYLIVGLRFLLPQFLIRLLNLLELTPMQLTLIAYTRLISFYLIFRNNRVGSPTDNIIRHCFLLKKCPFSKKPSSKAQHDGVYYLSTRASDYWKLLQLDIKSNVWDYKTIYFILRAPKSSPSNINVSFCHLVSWFSDEMSCLI